MQANWRTMRHVTMTCSQLCWCSSNVEASAIFFMRGLGRPAAQAKSLEPGHISIPARYGGALNG